MMITETTILWLCFIITFGFIGFKLTGFIKKKLDTYIAEADRRIAESEGLKIKSIKALDEIKRNIDSLGDVIDAENARVETSTNDIKKHFAEKLDASILKIKNESEAKKEYEKQALFDEVKDELRKIITESIHEIAGKIDKKNGNLVEKSVVKIDFKKLVEN